MPSLKKQSWCLCGSKSPWNWRMFEKTVVCVWMWTLMQRFIVLWCFKGCSKRFYSILIDFHKHLWMKFSWKQLFSVSPRLFTLSSSPASSSSSLLPVSSPLASSSSSLLGCSSICSFVSLCSPCYRCFSSCCFYCSVPVFYLSVNKLGGKS